MKTPQPEPDVFVSVNETCARYSIARRTFYRMLQREPELSEVVVRIPPETGRLRVPLKRFETWLRGRQ